MKNSIKKSNLFFLLFLSVFFIQCDCDEHVWMEYAGTKCADPWHTNLNDSNIAVKNAVTDYFDEIDIDILRVRVWFDTELVEDCEACTCQSGQLIQILVDESFIDEAEEEGFEEI